MEAIGRRNVEASLLALAGGFVVDRPESPMLHRAAELAAAMRRSGKRMPVADTWIAAAVRDDHMVNSNKRDFTRLGVEAWHYEDEPDPRR